MLLPSRTVAGLGRESRTSGTEYQGVNPYATEPEISWSSLVATGSLRYRRHSVKVGQ